MRSHLLIQGPMTSFFTKYCRPQPGPDSVTVDGKPAFDANRNVIRLAETYGHRFDSIVLATWDDQPLASAERLESLGVIIERTSSQSVSHLANHFKQVVGVLDGARAIPNLAAGDRITKTRTDLDFNL